MADFRAAAESTRLCGLLDQVGEAQTHEGYKLSQMLLRGEIDSLTQTQLSASLSELNQTCKATSLMGKYSVWMDSVAPPATVERDASGQIRGIEFTPQPRNGVALYERGVGLSFHLDVKSK